jgi:outer membrane protein assembly factor BamE (lipoprotein component of BamABCDE complex)
VVDAAIRSALAALFLLATQAPAPGARAEPAGSAQLVATDWRSPASWRRLRVGMSQAEVAQILGEPGKVTRYYAFTRWEYPDALGRRVNFDERGRLLAWGPVAR